MQILPHLSDHSSHAAATRDTVERDCQASYGLRAADAHVQQRRKSLGLTVLLGVSHSKDSFSESSGSAYACMMQSTPGDI